MSWFFQYITVGTAGCRSTNVTDVQNGLAKEYIYFFLIFPYEANIASQFHGSRQIMIFGRSTMLNTWRLDFIIYTLNGTQIYVRPPTKYTKSHPTLYFIINPLLLKITCSFTSRPLIHSVFHVDSRNWSSSFAAKDISLCMFSDRIIF